MGSQSVVRCDRIMFHGSGDIPPSHDAHITDFPKFEQGQWSLDSAVPFWDLAEISSVRCRCVMISVKLDVIMYGSTWKHLEAVGGTVICTKTPELQMLTKSTNKQGFYDDLRSDNDIAKIAYINPVVISPTYFSRLVVYKDNSVSIQQFTLLVTDCCR